MGESACSNQQYCTQLKENDFSADIQKHLANKEDSHYSLDNLGPIFIFLGTVKATTKSVSYTEEAAKAACQLLPSVLVFPESCLLYHQAAYFCFK